jgi:phosphatidylglycerol:prolipoprotein diacylglycerol transferase
VLPFVFADETKLGPFHPFGICCALGFFLWDWAFMKRGLQKGYTRGDLRALTVWLLVVGTMGSMSVDTIFYDGLSREGAGILSRLQGFSMTGGFVGALVGGIAWRYVFVGRVDGKMTVRLRTEPQPLLRASDLIISTWALALACGRLGCAIIHDHPGITVAHGTLSSLFAVAWPRGPEDGIHHVLGPIHLVTGGSDARFDLGLLEFFFCAALSIGYVATWKRDVKLGTYTIVGTITYGAFRFLSDFLRMDDVRHGGLTFAQYWGLAMIAVGVTVLVRRTMRERSAAAPAGA